MTREESFADIVFFSSMNWITLSKAEFEELYKLTDRHITVGSLCFPITYLWKKGDEQSMMLKYIYDMSGRGAQPRELYYRTRIRS